MDLEVSMSHPKSHLILSDRSNNSTNSTSAVAPELLEHHHRLVEGFGFSRWFILTYQPVVIGVVLLVAISRWHGKRARARARRRRGKRTGEKEMRRDSKDVRHPRKEHGGSGNGQGSPSSNSSSRTREGNTTPPDQSTKASDEWTRLLDEDGKRSLSKDRTSPWQSISRRMKYILTYQPPPTPYIHKILPPNTTSLWIITLFALNILYLFLNIGITPSMHDIIADRAGLLFTANLPWLYFLAAKTQPLKLLTGDSYENLNMLHRRLGEWMCFLAAIHLGGMIWGWYDFLRPSGFDLVRLLTIPYILWGCAAWVAYEVLYLMSLGSFREWWYEVFLGSHVLLQFGGLVLLWLHHFRARGFVLAALLIFGLDRFVWRLGIKMCEMPAELKVLDDGETVLVSADWPVIPKTGLWRKTFGWDMRFGWNPSEHVFISIPSMGRKYKYQFHPMTIASGAPGPGQTHAWFNLIIRAKGGFSRDLLHYAQTASSTKIRLDGPYGSLHALEMLHNSDVAIIVVGGSGIAVAYPLLWSLLHHNSPLDTTGSYTSYRKQQVCLIWIIQDASHISWIGSERLEELKDLGLHLVIPPPSRKEGRPDVNALLEEQVEVLREDGDSVGVIVSGPNGLNRTVQNCCAGMGRRGWEIEVAVEKFGW